jgi:hypothetical protein
MGLKQDQFTLATLTAQSSNFTGTVFDFSGYTGGTIYHNITVTGTTMTPDFQMTIDGTNWISIPTAILSARAALTAVGLVAYTFTNGMGIGKIRYVATAFTGAFTASVVAIVNHG